MDIENALYQRTMGYPYDEDVYLRAVSNGLAGPLHRSDRATTTLPFPNYDGTDSPDAFLGFNSQPIEVVTNPDYRIESLDESKSPLEWLEIAGKRIDELEGTLQQSGEIQLTDDDRQLLNMIISVEQVETTTNMQLRDEHPKFTRAVDAWIANDLLYTGVHGEVEQPFAKMDVLDRVMIDLREEVAGFERELQWLQEWGEKQSRQTELSDGIEYFYGLIDVCQHQRLETLATIERATLERLYALAA
ncbi:MAG: hypothetical protein KA069_02285 [Candidatus Saccharimonas sp.]|nr:hypothetical protein [Candidatus Saccharimonas sp.]